MSIVKHFDKKTGRTLVYESTSHYDPETKQSRPKRKYLGMLDDDGNLIPSSGRKGRRPGSKNRPKNEPTIGPDEQQSDSNHAPQQSDQESSVLKALADKDEAIKDLKRQVADLSAKLEDYRESFNKISAIIENLH